MKEFKFLISSAIFFCSSYAVAGWHEAKIATTHTFLNGWVAVYTDTNHECGSNQIGMDQTTVGFQRVYSALLAYEAQGKNVKFAIQSCNGTIGIIDRVVSVN
jgi:hypothetical protein